MMKFERKNQLEFKSFKNMTILENDNKQSFTKIFDTDKSNWLHFLISLENSHFWPCLYFSDKCFVIFMMPFIPEIYTKEFKAKDDEEKGLLISKTFCFSGCLAFAKHLLEYLSKENLTKADLLKITEFQNILAHAIPYGRVMDHNFLQIKEMLNKQKFSHTDNLINTYINNTESCKIPQYKLYFHEGKQEMELIIEEGIISYQFCKEDMPDFHEIVGQIYCLANFHENPEITLSIQGITKEIFASFRMIIPGKIYKTESIKNDGLKLIFYPKNKLFLLSSYQTNDNFEIPIKGIFQKKEISADLIKILVTLTISKKLVKFIENIEVEMNFKKFYRIIKTNLNIPLGYINYKDKSTLKWEINGNQLNQDNLEFSLTGTVCLISNENPEMEISNKGKNTEENETDVPNLNNGELWKNIDKMKVLLENFCLPENYIVLNFKIKNSLMTNIDINPETISIYPYKKPKIKIVRKSFTSKYYIYDMLNHDFQSFFANYRKKFNEKNNK